MSYFYATISVHVVEKDEYYWSTTSIPRFAFYHAPRFCHMFLLCSTGWLARYCSYLLPLDILGTHKEKYNTTWCRVGCETRYTCGTSIKFILFYHMHAYCGIRTLIYGSEDVRTAFPNTGMGTDDSANVIPSLTPKTALIILPPFPSRSSQRQR